MISKSPTGESVHSKSHIREPVNAAVYGLKKSLWVLLFLKRAQGALALLWATLSLVEWLPIFPSLPPVGILILVLLPFGIVLLATIQSWRSKSKFALYNEIKEQLTTDEIEGEQRAVALWVLHAYQLYSNPPLVKGTAGKSFAVTLLLLGFVSVMVLIIKL